MKKAVVRARHPLGLQLELDPQYQQFRYGGQQQRLTSVNKTLEKFFPFDAKRVAAAVAAKSGVTPAEVQDDWKLSAALGNNVAAAFASIVTRSPRPVPQTLHGDEDVFYPVAEKAAAALLQHYELVQAQPIMCSPDRFRIAGKFDFLCRNKATGALAGIDVRAAASSLPGWRFGVFDERCPAPLHHLAATKLTRFGLHSLICGYLLKSEGYSVFFGKELDELPFEHGIIHIGRRDGGLGVVADYHKVSAASMALLPPDNACEFDEVGMLVNAIRSPAMPL